MKEKEFAILQNSFIKLVSDVFDQGIKGERFLFDSFQTARTAVYQEGNYIYSPNLYLTIASYARGEKDPLPPLAPFMRGNSVHADLGKIRLPQSFGSYLLANEAYSLNQQLKIEGNFPGNNIVDKGKTFVTCRAEALTVLLPEDAQTGLAPFAPCVEVAPHEAVFVIAFDDAGTQLAEGAFYNQSEKSIDYPIQGRNAATKLNSDWQVAPMSFQNMDALYKENPDLSNRIMTSALNVLIFKGILGVPKYRTKGGGPADTTATVTPGIVTGGKAHDHGHVPFNAVDGFRSTPDSLRFLRIQGICCSAGKKEGSPELTSQQIMALFHQVHKLNSAELQKVAYASPVAAVKK